MCDCTNDPYTASCGTHFSKKIMRSISTIIAEENVQQQKCCEKRSLKPKWMEPVTHAHICLSLLFTVLWCENDWLWKRSLNQRQRKMFAMYCKWTGLNCGSVWGALIHAPLRTYTRLRLLWVLCNSFSAKWVFLRFQLFPSFHVTEQRVSWWCMFSKQLCLPWTENMLSGCGHPRKYMLMWTNGARWRYAGFRLWRVQSGYLAAK